MNKNGYSYLQIDCLKELSNIGGGNAATSISQMIARPVEMTVPTIDILDYESVYSEIMPEDEIVTAILMKMYGDSEGMFLYIINDDFLDELSAMILQDEKNIDRDLKLSSVKELVNVIVNSYLNAITKMIDVNVISSVPILTTDIFGAILSSVYIESGQYDDKIMIIKNEFLYLGKRLESSLYFVPQPGVLEKLFKKIGL